MALALVRVEGLRPAPLDAAADFHARLLPQIRAALDGVEGLTVHFPPADHAHRGWRLAAMQELAREAAPKRVNGVEGDAGDALAATLDYLARAPGVTGQLLALDGTGAGNLPN